MFAQFVKVNEATGEFTGIAAEEIPDQAGEIFDYEASKPLIKAWSDDSFEHSGGKSRGNLRAMHDPKRAAGLLTAITFNDAAKRVEVSGQVVDTEELTKLAKGVYTGLSFGGSYAWRKQEGIHVRYAAKPVELSLADKPCVPTAHFTLVKADGSEVEMGFKKIAARSDTDPKEGEEKYGDVKFADEKNKKYPIDTEKHIRAAWNYINKEKNAAKYSAEDLKSIKGKIIAAWKEKIDKDGPPSAEKTVGRESAAHPALQKDLYTVSYFAQLITQLSDMAVSIDWEAVSEMDDSPLPGQFKEWLVQGGEILKAMAAEEVDELLADLSKVEGRDALRFPALQKAGARHSAADQERVQQIHNHAAALGADCPGAEKVVGAGLKAAQDPQAGTPAPQDLEKTLQAKNEELAKAHSDLDAAKADLAKVSAENEALSLEVEKLKAEPAPAKGALKTVPKEADALNKTTETEEPRTALEEIAAARQKPFIIR
jgi:regulator of replication initiation timing